MPKYLRIFEYATLRSISLPDLSINCSIMMFAWKAFVGKVVGLVSLLALPHLYYSRAAASKKPFASDLARLNRCLARFWTLTIHLRLEPLNEFVPATSTKVGLPEANIYSHRDDDGGPPSERTPIHTADIWLWRDGEHAGDEEAKLTEDRDRVDDVSTPHPEAEGRFRRKGAINADSVAVIYPAGNADHVGAQDSGIANRLDVDEGRG